MPRRFNMEDHIPGGLKFLRDKVEYWDEFPTKEHVVKLLEDDDYDVLRGRVEDMDAAEFYNFLQFNVYGDSDEVFS